MNKRKFSKKRLYKFVHTLVIIIAIPAIILIVWSLTAKPTNDLQSIGIYDYTIPLRLGR